MKLRAKLGWMITTILAAVSLSFTVLTAAADTYDPPGRVARIRYIQGSVSFQPAGESDWVPAVTNRPVTIGDQLWADANSRAELDVGSTVIRMDANTGFSFLNLDDRTIQIQLTQGNLNLRVHRLGRDQVVEVDTPNEAFTVAQPGRYRIEAGADGNSSIVTIRQGQGQVTGGGNTYDLYSGQSGTFTGTDSSLDGQMASVSNPDDFDSWSDSRDHQYESSQSARYVSSDVVGYEDLDANGTWTTDPTYGNVWEPTSVQSGWAPYRNGHWVWISPWGWTWVDDDPWGYAPFHYGRWVSMRGRWGWVPGPVNVQPVYAPALVAFIGGPNFGVSISVGGGGDVGWFPLGPREVYVPAYSASRGYFDRVNNSNTTVSTTTVTNVYNNQVTNNTTITNVTYVNRTVPGAVTAVPQTAFRSAAPVERAAVFVDPKQISAAPVAPRAAVVPTTESVLGTSVARATRMARPPAAVANRPVVAKTTPPPPPVPFAKQQQELAKHPGQPLAPHEVQVLRPASAAAAHSLVKQAPPAKPATLKAAAAGNANQPAAEQRAAQQQAAQQQAEKARQQQAQQQAAQQQAEKARQQQAQQQAAQQQAEKAREQQLAQQQAQQHADRPPAAQPAPQPKPQPAQQPQAASPQPQTPAEKAQEEQKKKEQKPTPPLPQQP